MKILLRVLIFLLILSNFVLLSYAYLRTTSYAVFEREKGVIERVIDGDTIEINFTDKIEKIRFLGVNCPEKKEKGFDEAKNYTSGFVGKEVEIEYSEKDKYGRILAYVFLDNTNLNEELVKQGLAHTYYYEEDKYTKELEKQEEKAREEERGIWKKSKERCTDCIKLKKLNAKEEFFILINECEFKCDLNGWRVKDEATHFFNLNFSLSSGEEKKIESKTKIWNDDSDKFFLRDDSGLVLFYEY